jgi:D-alanyl-D-alanine carboxypeptidase
MADVEGEIPMEPDTPFRTHGISNMMMGALALKLAEEGLLGLDDPISQYLDAAIIEQLNGPDGEPYGEAITVRQLLNGTSGNASYFLQSSDHYDLDRSKSSDFEEIVLMDPDKVWQPEEIITYTTDNLEAVSAPGEGFAPYDLGYVLLGLVVEAATGGDLGEAYRTRLFEPLGMEQTYMVQPGDPRLEEVAHVYAVKGVDISDFASLSWFRGDVVSTVDDLNRFMRAWADNEIFADPASKEAMTEWVSMADAGIEGYSYGLGLAKVDFSHSDVPEVEMHLGHPSIWNGFLYYWPKHNIIFAGMINQAIPVNSYGHLTGQVLETLLEYVQEE